MSKYTEVVVFVTGTTPQIITETLYALIHRQPSVRADEVHIITTSHGASLVKENLFDSGVFHEFCKEFRLSKNILTEKSIHIIDNGKEGQINDIISEKDNERLGDFILSFIKDKTEDDHIRLHCSLAGGRKTMSFYLGAALQLLGRPCDRLYHVLVSPEFESTPDFYYKPKTSRMLTHRGRVLNTRDAVIHLAELPLILLREKLSQDGLSFRQMVKEGQRDIDTAITQPALELNRARQQVMIGNTHIRLTPIQLMVYTAYLRHKLHNCSLPDRQYCRDCMDCFPSLLDVSTKSSFEEMVKDYRVIAPSRADDLLYKYRTGLPLEIIRQAISKIKKAVLVGLGNESIASHYSITTSIRTYANTRHGIRVEKEKIRIV